MRADRWTVFVDLLARLANAGLGAYLGFVVGVSRIVRHLRRLVNHIFDTGMGTGSVSLAFTLLGAAAGFIWGKRIWAYIDRRIFGRWGDLP